MMITSHEIKEVTTNDIAQGNKREGIIQRTHITKQSKITDTHILLDIHAGFFLLHHLPFLKGRAGVNYILSRSLSVEAFDIHISFYVPSYPDLNFKIVV